MKKPFILYIEDEEFQAKLFSKIISDQIVGLGCEVVVINNGQEAFDFFVGKKNSKVKISEVGLILLDLAIYDVSGFQILKGLLDLKLKIPVAVLSAREDEKTKKEAKKLGAIDYFVKGKDLAELSRLRDFIIKSVS